MPRFEQLTMLQVFAQEVALQTVGARMIEVGLEAVRVKRQLQIDVGCVLYAEDYNSVEELNLSEAHARQELSHLQLTWQMSQVLSTNKSVVFETDVRVF